MQTSIIVFPGSNCDRDSAVATEKLTGKKPHMVWHKDTSVPKSDLIIVPGGFSHGDYLRSGAMAARASIMKDVIAKAKSGVAILGICNGFQILTESGLLPGALMRNRDLKFICKDVYLRTERNDTIFTRHYKDGGVIKVPIAHHDGNYFADDDTLARLEGEGQIAFRYCSNKGAVNDEANPNGSANNIAGIYNDTGCILGLMPHPERLFEPALGGTDGAGLFTSLLEHAA